MLRLFLTIVYLYSSAAFSVEIRKSTVLPWDGGPELGYCIERRESESGLISVSVSTNGNIETDHVDDLSLILPDNGPGGGLGSQLWPSSLASAVLLRSPELMRISEGKSILELGCGVGLSGLAAAANGATCCLSDEDDAVIEALGRTLQLNSDTFKGNLSVATLDWKDQHDRDTSYDLILGSDVAYYHYLLTPLMSTTRAFLKDDAHVIFVGQANRQCFWDLYNNIKGGHYNQLTDEHDPPWDGETCMLLYKLRMSSWVHDDEAFDDATEGVIPISVVLHHSHALGDLRPFAPFSHVATDADDDGIMKSF